MDSTEYVRSGVCVLVESQLRYERRHYFSQSLDAAVELEKFCYDEQHWLIVALQHGH